MQAATTIGRGAARRVRWSAILAGALTALAVQFALALLAIAIGAAVAQPGDADASGVGDAVAWLVASLVALACGGRVAGRLCGDAGRADAALHGFLSWALATLAIVALLGTALGALAGGALRVATSVARGAAAGALPWSSAGGEADGGQAWSRLRDQVERTLRASGRPELQPDALRQPDQARAGANADDDQRLVDALRDAVTGGRVAVSGADRDALVNALAARAGIPREQAEQTLDRWTDAYQRGRDQAKRAANDAARAAASATAIAAWWSFAALGVGAALAAGAGSLGPRRGGATLHAADRAMRGAMPHHAATGARGPGDGSGSRDPATSAGAGGDGTPLGAALTTIRRRAEGR